MNRAGWPLHVFGLWALAVVHPLLDLLAGSPEFFVAHRASAGDIVLLLLALLLALPLPLLGAILVGGAITARLKAATLATVIGMLATMLALQVLNKAGVDAWTMAVPIAALSGIALAYAYSTVPSVRTFATVLSAAIVLVPLVFVARPGIRELLTPRRSQASAANVPPARPVPVVMIVFDELSLVALLDVNGTIEEAHYPNLAALAREGAWYRNATTVNDFTRWALPAILSARYPSRDSIPTPSSFPNTLFTLLARTHRFEVDEATTDLCPPELCRSKEDSRVDRWRAMASDLWLVYLHVLLTEDLREHLPDVTGAWGGFSASSPVEKETVSPNAWLRRWHQRSSENRQEVALRFIDGISAADPQPTLYFMHSMLSHHLYTLLPSGQQNATRARAPYPKVVSGIDDPWALIQQQQRQLLHTGYIDTVVGRLISRLRDQGLYERTLIVLTSDHGAALRPGAPFRYFTEAAASDIMRVPLIIKFPANSPPAASGTALPHALTSDVNAETVDILPTIADALGTRLPWATNGRSLLDPAAPERTRKHFVAANQWREHSYGADGPPLRSFLQKKHEVFDGAANRYRVPRPFRFSDLVGRSLDSLKVLDSEALVDVHDAWAFTHFEPSPNAVAFDVSGRMLKRPPGDGPVYLAVAVNGVIRAVTQTWKTRPDEWMATPPVDSWRRGRNVLDVLVVEEANGEPVLRRAFRPKRRPAGVNLIARSARDWGIQQRGLYQEEVRRDRMIRWTDRRAEIIVPLDERRPRALGIKVARSSRPEHRFRISVAHCVLFDGRVPSPEWDSTFALDRCPVTGDTLKIVLESDVVRPPRDSRELGVALRSIVLEEAPLPDGKP